MSGQQTSLCAPSGNLLDIFRSECDALARVHYYLGWENICVIYFPFFFCCCWKMWPRSEGRGRQPKALQCQRCGGTSSAVEVTNKARLRHVHLWHNSLGVVLCTCLLPDRKTVVALLSPLPLVCSGSRSTVARIGAALCRKWVLPWRFDYFYLSVWI